MAIKIAQCWSDCTEKTVAKLHCLECLVAQFFQIAVRIAGLITFVMFIIGGFKYLTAGGKPEATQSAQKTLTYAVLGLVLILGGWFILKFIKVFTGVDVTIFEFPKPTP